MAKRSSDSEAPIKRDSVYTLYIAMVEKIKNNPKIYLNHINKAIKVGKVEYDGSERIIYNYIYDPYLLEDLSLYSLTRLDAYKAIKRSLFERKEGQLPERTFFYIKRGGKVRDGFKVPILPCAR